MGGGVESPQGIDTPGVDSLLRGDETPVVATEDDGVTGEGGRRRGGDRTPPTTQESKDSRANDGNNGRACGPRTAAEPCPRDMAAGNDSAGPLLRKSDGTDGARSKNGKHLSREYDLLAPE